jgi:hypothetical protein
MQRNSNNNPKRTKKPVAKPSIRVPSADKDVGFAVRVADASVNRSIPKGAHAMCAPLEDRVYSGQEFAVGNILYIEARTARPD